MSTDAVGGVWSYSLELARGLGRRGMRVVLACMGREPSPAKRRDAAEIETLVLECRPYKLEWMKDPWDDVRSAGDWLLELESRFRPDVIHLNNYAHGSLEWSAPVLVVGHSCVCSWFRAVRGEEPPEEWRSYREVVRRGLRGADAVAAPTGAMLAELKRFYGPFASSSVVYNARRTDSLIPRRPEPFVLTAGRLWDEAKNMGSLDAAAAQIDWPVFAAGAVENPDGGDVRFDALRLLGTLPPAELGRWMGRASIYALPARYEPFGLTALEAAHAGCALVLGDIASLREVWQDAALFVPPNDPNALAQAISALAREPARLEKLARRAARRARTYSVENMVDAYLDLYAGMCRAPRRMPQRSRLRSRRSANPLESAARITQ